MRVVFSGTPEFSVPCLEVLVDSPDISVVGVYTQPDRRSGRGKALTPSAVKLCALKHELPVFQPENFANIHDQKVLENLAPDLILVVAYGLILPKAVLDLPPLGCLNIHASLLPRWRGAAPIQRCIEAGDTQTGVTLMQIEPRLDSGPMLAEKKIPVSEEDTGGSLHDKLSLLGASLLKENLSAIRAGSLQPRLQDESRVCYAPKLSRADSMIDWHLSADVLERKVRALNPWPVASTSLAGSVLRILQSSVIQSNKGTQPGEIVSASKEGILVQTGEGILKLEVVQKPGGKLLLAADFLNGMPLEPGTVLG